MEVLADRAVRPSWLPSAAKLGLVFNVMSGSVTAPELNVLFDALGEHGVSCCCIYALSELDLLHQDADGLDLIVVLGGDGTARAVAEAAPPHGPPLLLLPGGTLNILPKALLGDRAWQEALREALAHGEVRRLIGGVANGEAFFIAAMFGAPTLLARTREAIREGKWNKAWRRFQLFQNRVFSAGLVGRPDGGRMRPSEAVGVLCPSFSGAVEGNGLEWVRMEARTIADLLRIGIRALGPKWRDDPAVHASICSTGVILGRGLVPGTLDGEPRTFQAPIKIAYNNHGPQVITLPH